MSQTHSVIVFGASGNVGQYVVPALLKANITTTVATRAGSTPNFPHEAKVVTADYDSLENLTSLIRGHDIVISLITARAAASQKLLIDAAIRAGAGYFIPSEFGHDATNGDITPLLPIFKVKREVAAYLREKESQGLKWTGITTALFFDWGLPFGSFDINLKEGTTTIWDGGNTVFSAANMEDISAGIIQLITDPATRAEYANQIVYVSTVQTTQNEILAAAEAVTGKKFEVKHRDSKAAFEDPSKVMDVLRAIQLSDRGLSDYAKRVHAGHGKFLVDRKRGVKEVLAEVLAGV